MSSSGTNHTNPTKSDCRRTPTSLNNSSSPRKPAVSRKPFLSTLWTRVGSAMWGCRLQCKPRKPHHAATCSPSPTQHWRQALVNCETCYPMRFPLDEHTRNGNNGAIPCYIQRQIFIVHYGDNQRLLEAIAKHIRSELVYECELHKPFAWTYP